MDCLKSNPRFYSDRSVTNCLRHDKAVSTLSVTKTNHLVLYRKIITVDCENNAKHTKALWADSKIVNVEHGGTCSNH